MREQIELLKHHADLTANYSYVLEVRCEFDSLDQDLALLMLLQPVYAADDGRFPRTRWTTDHRAFTLTNAETYVIQRLE